MKSTNPVVQQALDARAERMAREVVTNMVRRRRVTNPVVADALRQYGILVENGQYEVPVSVRQVLNAPKFGTQAYEDWGKRNGLKKDKTGHYHKEGDAPKVSEPKATEKADETDQKEAKSEPEKPLEEPKAKEPTAEETARKGLTEDENRTLDGIVAQEKSAGKYVDLKTTAEEIVAMKDEIETASDDHKQKELALRQVAVAEKLLDGMKPKAEAGPKGQDGTPGDKGEVSVSAADFEPEKLMAEGKVDAETWERMSRIGNFTDADGKVHDTRVSVSTGQPISRAFNNLVTAMNCGVDVPDSVIEAMPEWKEAQERARSIERPLEKASFVNGKGRIDLSMDKSPERIEQREEIMRKMLAPVVTAEINEALKENKKDPGRTIGPYEVERGRQIDIVIGLPSAGKSSAFVNGLSVANKARVVDSDTAKSMVKDVFDNGYGANAVHEYSSSIVEGEGGVLDQARERGENICLPILGKKPEKLLKLLEKFKAAGYTCNLHYNDLPPAKAKGRLVNRWLEKGRFLPLVCVSGAGDSPKQTYLAVRDKFDHAEAKSNDVPMGEDPRALTDEDLTR